MTAGAAVGVSSAARQWDDEEEEVIQAPVVAAPSAATVKLFYISVTGIRFIH